MGEQNIIQDVFEWQKNWLIWTITSINISCSYNWKTFAQILYVMY
jgi:hypothetical protein